MRQGFNPRPREGATPSMMLSPVALCFNPRPREGATVNAILLRRGRHVSIHAPVKGRRRAPGAPCRLEWCFNPRPREGATS